MVCCDRKADGETVREANPAAGRGPMQSSSNVEEAPIKVDRIYADYLEILAILAWGFDLKCVCCISSVHILIETCGGLGFGV